MSFSDSLYVNVYEKKSKLEEVFNKKFVIEDSENYVVEG